MRTRIALALAAAVALSLPVAAAEAAKVKLVKRTGTSVEAKQSPGFDGKYTTSANDDPTTFCRNGRKLLTAGWGASGGFVGRIDVRLDNRLGDYMDLDQRNTLTGKMRPIAICASGPVKRTIKRSKSGTVRCGSGKLTLGLAAPNGSPFQTAAAVAKPNSSATRFENNLGDDDKEAAAICVGKSAFKSVKVAKKSTTFKVGSETATVNVTCPGKRRPISWGYEAAVMEQNTYRESGITNVRTTAFPSISQPRGSRGWQMRFQTADLEGAKTDAKVTAYVTCAIPR